MSNREPTPPASPAAGPPTPSPGAAEAWVFDLDNTLYSVSHGLFDQIDRRIKAYVGEFLGIEPDAAYRVQKTYFRDYGSTLRGLMTRHDMQPAAFLDYVHDIDISVVPPAPELGDALAAIAGRKVIFTNADAAHAGRILERLGISGHFEGIFDITASDWLPKPAPETYARLVEHFRLDPRRTVMVEDIARNLAPARALGMTTVWVRTAAPCEVVGAPPEELAEIDFVTDDLTAWLKAL